MWLFVGLVHLIIEENWPMCGVLCRWTLIHEPAMSVGIVTLKTHFLGQSVRAGLVGVGGELGSLPRKKQTRRSGCETGEGGTLERQSGGTKH